MSEQRPGYAGYLPNRSHSLARRVASELAVGGAKAVVIVGSHARGEAGPESDLDLLAVGDESYPPRLDVREGTLVSVSMQPLAEHRGAFEEPDLVCEVVPGWRDALVMHDPEGLAASLVGQARGWTWGPLERRCDGWVAEEVTARAETVHKLVGALGGGWPPTSSVKRTLLATRLARVLGVHCRILYGSEDRLWHLLPEAMGEEWGQAQSAALGRDGSLAASCAAALRMYELAAVEVTHLLDDRQERVVRQARAVAAAHLGR